MNRLILKTILAATLISGNFSLSHAQALSDEQLAREGARIGRAYYMATKNNDADLQNDALLQFNEILTTLKKQAQVDILTNAFNNVNIPIDKPEIDAKRYTRALMNAYRTGDSIAIEDATDIAQTVKNIYAIERSADEASRYATLYDLTATCAMLGYEYSQTNEYATRTSLSMQAEEIQKGLSSDAEASQLLKNTFDYYSIALSTPEEDATKYSELMRKATSSGEQAQVDEVARITGMVYERYSLERSTDEAKKFNTLLNEQLATENK